ncbi:MAG: Lrp/AsnC ligand binding domain-containing protein [Victivallales bacterium]|nr:Lrp/AsnC ligand binding domain-containing protein [Victivallales bacterium]MCF7888927.1 Lrp/AsnC ligand binding domain-containing protein [Victivallales bacterium]
MTTAIILFNVKRSKLKEAFNEVKKIKGITDIYTVAGEYDFVAIFRAEDSSNLSKILTEEIVNIDVISRTKTLIALDTFSVIDLEKAYKL